MNLWVMGRGLSMPFLEIGCAALMGGWLGQSAILFASLAVICGDWKLQRTERSSDQ